MNSYIRNFIWFLCFFLLPSFFPILAKITEASDTSYNPLLSTFSVNVANGKYSPSVWENDATHFTLINDYYIQGMNHLGTISILISSPTDPRIGRIKSQSIQQEPNQSPEILATYFYETDRTEVYDNFHHKTIYHLSKDRKRVTKIEGFVGGDSGDYVLYRTEIFSYEPLSKDDQYRVISHKLYDGQGNLIETKGYLPPKSAEGPKDPLEPLLRIIQGETLYWASSVFVEPCAGKYGMDEPDDEIRITFINGILNQESDINTSLELISKAHNNRPVHYVYRGTNGWVKDSIDTNLIKLGIITSESAIRLANLWKKLIAEMGGIEGKGVIVHYAHSIGGTETCAAKKLLLPEEARKIRVIAFGTATVIHHDSGFHSVVNYISYRDGVPLTHPFQYPYSSPFLYLQALLSKKDHVVFIGTPAGVPLIDHMFETYWSYWLENSEKDMGMKLSK